MKAFVKIVAAFLIVICIGCNSKEEPTINTDVDKLAKSINLAVKPVAARWVFTTEGDGMLGPSDYKILAVLKYNHTDWLSLYKEHKMLKPIEDECLSKEIMKDWYTESVKACFKNNGKYLSVTKDVYNVDAFAKNSFIHGYCFFTDNDEVFLYTYTM
ncbi:hypothetical protein R1T16_09570 [Flavobacterium sp. DG1-102-2]|uniref:hypothetical protein n=1 Tax=Flavobacterium sp. DG1-102-2 TaxID=3081663 RepID=UPI0029493460|nr:hypothetical protein [Flavobacterium sp. DG1-102-2]MDV6168672.1 hypothetical protein [Flavobacterium sp. DG1-102-2]